MIQSLHKKAQMSMVDLFMAISIFIILIIAIALLWYNYKVKLAEDFAYEDLQVKAFQVSDLLVKSPGKPSKWEDNISSLGVIGLAESDRVLSKEKVEAFENISHNLGVKTLNLGGYNYYFELGSANGGLQPNGDIVFTIKRYVLYEGQEKVFEFTLWK